MQRRSPRIRIAVRERRRHVGSMRNCTVQFTLFEPSDRILVDDDRGCITYVPAVIDEATSASWFAELRSAVPWRSERRQMYDRRSPCPG